jgi:6-pyruvoyltetrahydropterin/6-carboxytetrahydropterin synthase
MATAYLTRILEFTATHRLPHDHSHRYQCHVTVKGALRAAEGGIVDLATLDALLEREIVARLDGRHIDDDIPEFKDGKWRATGEAVAVYLWGRLARALPQGVTLHAVRVQESPHLYSEYFGEGD